MSRTWHWICDRWPLTAIFRMGFDEEIPGGSRYAYTLGSATLVVFLLQVVTGVWQMFYYVPTVDHAYTSIDFLTTQVPFGWLIHGLHYWGANAMIVLVGLHMIRVFVWGGYAKPRELTWIVGVFLILFTAGMMFTGALLHWDELGYWAAEVGTSIAGTVPFIGNFLKEVMRGGQSMGQLTLSRFFILHIAILPGLLVLLIGIHLIAFRQFGSVGPWKEEKRQVSGPFWPDQVFKDTVVAMLLILVLIALVVYYPPPITGPADPVDASYHPKPEWNFLFLYQALKFFHGSWEPVGTMLLPTIAVVVLLAIPFMDRHGERGPLRRPIALSGGSLLAAAVITLTVFGYYSNPAGESGPSPGKPITAAYLSAEARKGADLFETMGCSSCHRVNGSGGTFGPDLSKEGAKNRSQQWLADQIVNPKGHNPNSTMPSFALSKQKVDDMVDFLQTLGRSDPPSSAQTDPAPSAHTDPAPSARTDPGASSDPPPAPAVDPPPQKPDPAALSAPVSKPAVKPGLAATIIGSWEHGAGLYTLYCASCHGSRGVGGVDNPGSAGGKIPALNPIPRNLFSKTPQVFADNIDPFLQAGPTPAGRNPEFKMVAFGHTRALPQQEIADLEAYIMHLNGVDRAGADHPGLLPKQFFVLALILLILAGLGLGALWLRLKSRAERMRT